MASLNQDFTLKGDPVPLLSSNYQVVVGSSYLTSLKSGTGATSCRQMNGQTGKVKKQKKNIKQKMKKKIKIVQQTDRLIGGHVKSK